MDTLKIAAVVVTYNRLELLKECIESLRNQTRKPDEIIVVNNSSTDGTIEWLEEQEDLTVITQENLGSAGGQYTGIKTAFEKGYDWIWCMDDDTIVNRHNLVTTLNFINQRNYGKLGFIASKVLWIDQTPHKMNLPGLFYPQNRWIFIGNNIYSQEYTKIDVASFVSIYFSRIAIEKVGFPNRKYFLYYDDLQYTHRFKNFNNYYLKNSIAYHKTPTNNSVDVFKKVNNKSYYAIRNFVYFYKKVNVLYIIRFFLYGVYSQIFVVKTLNGLFNFIKFFVSGLIGKMGKL